MPVKDDIILCTYSINSGHLV